MKPDTESNWMLCLGCEAAVRPIDGSPCPLCGRCAFCGQKISTGFDCDCGKVSQAEFLKRFLKDHAIPADKIERKKRCLVLRQKNKDKKTDLSSAKFFRSANPRSDSRTSFSNWRESIA